MEERIDEAPLAPGTAEETSLATEEASEEMTDSTWAEARPAPAIMAMVEKRMLMVLVDGVLVKCLSELSRWK